MKELSCGLEVVCVYGVYGAPAHLSSVLLPVSAYNRRKEAIDIPP